MPKPSLARYGLLVACLLSPTLAAAQAPPGWTLAWSDEFNSFDNARWEKETSTQPTNNSLHAYLPQQVATQGGHLVITTTNQPYQNLPYRSGLVTTREARLYGRWEVRAKLPTTTGMWPAIWLLPDTQQHPWPSGGEIDIMEARGNIPSTTSSAIHYGTNPPYNHLFVSNEQQTRIAGAGLVDYSSGFHTYAVEWSAASVRFFVDDVNYYTVHDDDVGGFLSQHVAPMRLILNTAVGGDFLPNPDASTVWPQQMLVDWVKVYDAAPGPVTRLLRNGGFDESGGALAGWSLLGPALPGNPNTSAAKEAVHAGEASLKLFGPFTGGATQSGVAQGISVSGGQQVEASLEALVRSNDSIAGGPNRAILRIEFYNQFGAEYGSASMLSQHTLLVANGSSPQDQWIAKSLTSTAPAGAVEARLSILFQQSNNAAGAVHVDDVRFAVLPGPAAMGDFNADGVVNAADYTSWRDTLGAAVPAGTGADGDGDGVIGPGDYLLWWSQYGIGAASLGVSAPEPAAFPVAAVGAAAVASRGWSRLAR